MIWGPRFDSQRAEKESPPASEGKAFQAGESSPVCASISGLGADGRYPVRAKMTILFWINVPEVGLGSATS